MTAPSALAFAKRLGLAVVDGAAVVGRPVGAAVLLVVQLPNGVAPVHPEGVAVAYQPLAIDPDDCRSSLRLRDVADSARLDASGRARLVTLDVRDDAVEPEGLQPREEHVLRSVGVIAELAGDLVRNGRRGRADGCLAHIGGRAHHDRLRRVPAGLRRRRTRGRPGRGPADDDGQAGDTARPRAARKRPARGGRQEGRRRGGLGVQNHGSRCPGLLGSSDLSRGR